MTEDDTMSETGRRSFLKGVLLGSAALTGAATGLMGQFDLNRGIGMAEARAQGTRYKMAFIQWQPPTVPAAGSLLATVSEKLGLSGVIPSPRIMR